MTKKVDAAQTPCCLTYTMITQAGSMLTTPSYLTCTMITEAGTLPITPCCLTCTMTTESDTADHTLLPNMYNHNRDRRSASSDFANYLTCTRVTAEVLYLRTSSSLSQKIIQFMINVLDWQKTRGILKM